MSNNDEWENMKKRASIGKLNIIYRDHKKEELSKIGMDSNERI